MKKPTIGSSKIVALTYSIDWRKKTDGEDRLTHFRPIESMHFKGSTYIVFFLPIRLAKYFKNVIHGMGSLKIKIA